MVPIFIQLANSDLEEKKRDISNNIIFQKSIDPYMVFLVKTNKLGRYIKYLKALLSFDVLPLFDITERQNPRGTH